MLNLKNRNFFLVLGIIFIGLLLRFWNFHNLFYFAIDEEKAAYIIKGIITGTHFPSVGHPSSIGFRLGPLLYYLIAPIYKIFGPHPVNWGFLSVFASLLSMILIYKIGAKIDKYTGIFSLLLYNFSYLNVLYDRRGWQVSFHSLIALTILYSLLKIKDGKQKYLFLLSLALIAASQFEVATLLFIPLVIIIWFVLKLKLKRQTILICIILFLLSQAGLIIFDARHNFLNTRYLINYFKPAAKERIAKNTPLSGIRKVYLAHNLIPSTFAGTLFASSEPNVAIQYANCPQYLELKQSQTPLILKLTVIVIFLSPFYFMLNKWKKQNDETVILNTIYLYFIIIFSGISIYTYIFHGEMAEFYLLSSFAYFFIILGFLLSKLFKSKIGIIVILFLIIFATNNIQKLFLSNNPYGLDNKKAAVNYSLSIVGNQPFMLDSFQTCWYSGGYRYLYTLKGYEPLVSYMDQYLSEYYTPDKITQPKYQVVILTPELIGNNPSGYDEYKEKINSIADYKERFGAIEVYLRKI